MAPELESSEVILHQDWQSAIGQGKSGALGPDKMGPSHLLPSLSAEMAYPYTMGELPSMAHRPWGSGQHYDSAHHAEA